MSILKRKKKKSEFRNVYMPLKKNSVSSKSKLKAKTNVSKRKHAKRNGLKLNYDKYKKAFAILLIIVFVLGFIYLSILFITNLRGGQTPKFPTATESVIGLEEIPAYPDSEFMFKNVMDNTSVSTFISSGNSAYKLPSEKDIDDVYEFYREQLPNKGWTFVVSAPIASDTMKSGEYWTKENTGLRIYTKYKDVWYESISKHEAENGLADRVKEELDRELLLTNQEAQDLLPDFPWLLKVSREYVITYTLAPYNEMRVLEIKKMGSEDKFLLTPIDQYKGHGLDFYLDKYIEYVNKKGVDNCGIKKTSIAYTPYSSAIKAEISCNKGLHKVAVFVHPNSSVVFILDSNSTGNLFFEEILKNLKPQESIRY